MTDIQNADALSRANAKLAEKIEKSLFIIEAEDPCAKTGVRFYAVSVKPTPNNSLLDFSAYELKSTQISKVVSWSDVQTVAEKEKISAHSITLPLSRVIRMINPKQLQLQK